MASSILQKKRTTSDFHKKKNYLHETILLNLLHVTCTGSQLFNMETEQGTRVAD